MKLFTKKTQKLSETQRFSGQRRKLPVSKFLKRTYQILEVKFSHKWENHPLSQDVRFTEYISWSVDGKSMLVKKSSDLAEKVFPHFFKHDNFSSFIRQVILIQNIFCDRLGLISDGISWINITLRKKKSQKWAWFTLIPFSRGIDRKYQIWCGLFQNSN